MNRPESRNALNQCPEPGAEPGAVRRAHRVPWQGGGDPAVRAMVLTGAGGTFCVGGDVKVMNEGSGRDVPERERIAVLRARMEAIDFAAPRAAGPTVTLGKIKQKSALSARRGSLGECFDSDARNHIPCAATADHKEAALVAKREPNCMGR
jgi:hypothetical protein